MRSKLLIQIIILCLSLNLYAFAKNNKANNNKKKKNKKEITKIYNYYNNYNYYINNTYKNYTKEETQYVIEGGIRVFDSKKCQIDAFVRYSNTINKVDTVGIRFTFKLGLSYEERLIKDLLERIKKLEEKSK